MPETTRFEIGAEATCSDGACGALTKVVIDPLAQSVTHLVIEPKHRSGLGKLVPLDLVDATGDELLVRCTLSQFDQLPAAEETEFLPGNNGGYGGYSPGQMVFLPHYRLIDANVAGDNAYDVANAFAPTVYDTIPAGEVEIRRGEQVTADDGQIGRIEGLVVDSATHHVTHILLQEGHLLGRKQVAIPIGAVQRIGDEVRVSMTKRQLQDLAPVGVEFPN